MGHWLNLARELTEAHDNSDNSDNSAKSPNKKLSPEPIVPSVTFVTSDQSEDTEEGKVIAWLNANPPDFPAAQNNCAACGEFIPVYDTGWFYLGDGALIHYSGKYGLGCWEVWKSKRRETAQAAISQTVASSKTGVDDDSIF